MQVPESQLLQIFEKSAPCMVVKADPPEFTIIMVSDAYLQMTGLKREDIVGKGSFTVFPGRADEPSGVNSTRNAIMEVIATKKKVTIPEYSYSILNQATQELEEFWWASTFAPILNENAEVAHVLGTALDLTEQVRSRNQVTSIEGNLRLQQKRLESFIMQAPAGICVLDGPELCFELVNPLYQQLFPGRKLLGHLLLDAVPEVAGSAIWDVLQDVYQTGKTFEGRELLIPLARTDNGPVEERYFDFIYQAKRDAMDQIDGILVFVIEVTDIVHTKASVLESAERFKNQLDAIPQIAWTNKAGGEVDNFNQQWYNYTGLKPEESEIWGWKNIIHPDILAVTMEKYNAILGNNDGGEFEVLLKRKDGEYRWHLVRIVPIEYNTLKIEQWIGTATDIQDLKLLQSQKDDFISIASHELKTPVTSLKAALQLMDKMKDRPSPEMFPKLIGQAIKSVDKITELIDDLLDASRVNESQLHIEKKTFNIYEMLTGCCVHVRAAGIHQLIFQGDKDLQVNADEHRIDQVIINFVNNAVKYAQESRNIYLIVEKLEEEAKISVRDEGPGINPEKLPHLFSKYYRAEYTGAQFSGLGLGLYISAEIIKRHGGKIGVDSEPGKGSTFWFTLPLT